MNHKAGFVCIIGKPNVGKSTLMNALLGEKISIISPKVQTTRNRILGILSKENYQMVFSDTPGIIDPKYKLQSSMMHSVNEGLKDADVVLFLTDSDPRNYTDEIIERLKLIKTPLIVVLNKVDKSDEKNILEKINELEGKIPCRELIPISALNKFNLEQLLNVILKELPEAPSYFPDDQLTDKSERFIAAEILREKIFSRYKEEIPYSVQVEIATFKDEPDILKIEAEIFVMRDSQKQILIGKGGIALKNVGVAARRDLEKFFGKQIFLKTLVKVKVNWRDDDLSLKHFGYGKN
ncbi:MAG: GTPase Era [Bacteroidia bacterium]